MLLVSNREATIIGNSNCKIWMKNIKSLLKRFLRAGLAQDQNHKGGIILKTRLYFWKLSQEAHPILNLNKRDQN